MSIHLLIDVVHDSETLALQIQNNKIINFQYHTGILNNIYLAKIVKIDTILQAIFVSFGSDKPGFLPIDNICDEYFDNIRNLQYLKKNQLILVQVEKEKKANKGVYLTTYISLAGKYCVLLPNAKTSMNGVSKQIESTDIRKYLQEFQQTLSSALHNKSFDTNLLNIIWRTAAEHADMKDLIVDYNELLQIWTKIQEIQSNTSSIGLVYEDAKGINKVLRDGYNADISKISVIGNISNDHLYALQKKYPIDKISKQDTELLLNKQFYDYIASLTSKIISLEGGGSICINITEALTAIDVNSAKSKRTSVLEINEKALKTAVEHIFKRNISGIIVIDLIDMETPQEHGYIESLAKQLFKYDKARVKILKINALGLLEISRQRTGLSTYDYLLEDCCECKSKYSKLNLNFIALMILRELYYKLYFNVFHTQQNFTLVVSHNIKNLIILQHQKQLLLWKKQFNTNIKIKTDSNLPDSNSHISQY